MEKKTENITLRCPPSLKLRVRNLAEQSHRSVSRQVIYLLELSLDTIERDGEQPRAFIKSKPKVVNWDEEDDAEQGGLAEW